MRFKWTINETGFLGKIKAWHKKKIKKNQPASQKEDS